MIIEWAKSREEKIRENRQKYRKNRIERESFECGRKGHFSHQCQAKDRPKKNSRSNSDRKDREYRRPR